MAELSTKPRARCQPLAIVIVDLRTTISLLLRLPQLKKPASLSPILMVECKIKSLLWLITSMFKGLNNAVIEQFVTVTVDAISMTVKIVNSSDSSEMYSIHIPRKK